MSLLNNFIKASVGVSLVLLATRAVVVRYEPEGKEGPIDKELLSANNTLFNRYLSPTTALRHESVATVAIFNSFRLLSSEEADARYTSFIEKLYGADAPESDFERAKLLRQKPRGMTESKLTDAELRGFYYFLLMRGAGLSEIEKVDLSKDSLETLAEKTYLLAERARGNQKGGVFVKCEAYSLEIKDAGLSAAFPIANNVSMENAAPYFRKLARPNYVNESQLAKEVADARREARLEIKSDPAKLVEWGGICALGLKTMMPNIN